MGYYKCEVCGTITDEVFDGHNHDCLCKDCYEEEDIKCEHCGCYEPRNEFIDGMCLDCFRDYQEDIDDEEE